jgi:selenide,water dikinase
LIVGVETADDGAVIRLDAGLALVQTVDFITPIVDDPYAFGGIAAANALSDIYAMGGIPLSALNIVCFPEDKLALEVLSEVLRGGQDKCREAACLVVGGHTVVDPELKYGLSVTGTIHPAEVVRNSTARPGDRLVLTKRLGTGILATALKRRKLADAEREEMTASMLELNSRAAAAMCRRGVHAATDVTGFGLVGHAGEMALGSGARLVFSAAHLPILPGARELARRGFLTGADRANRAYAGDRFRVVGRVDPDLVAIAFDAQTSGGLLVALPDAGAAALCAELPGAVAIGRVESGPPEVVLEP